MDEHVSVHLNAFCKITTIEPNLWEFTDIFLLHRDGSVPLEILKFYTNLMYVDSAEIYLVVGVCWRRWSRRLYL